MAFDADSLTPVISLERAVKRDADALDAGQSGEFTFQLIVEPANSFQGVSGSHGVDVDDIAIGGGETEILPLQVAESLRHQACADEEYERESSLKDDQSLLRQERSIASGTIQSSQGFGRIGVRRNPCRNNAEDNTCDQRQKKGEAKNNRGRRCRYRHLF